MKTRSRLLLLALVVPWLAHGQTVNSGSDGAFNPMKDTVINMADHPDGIYQYTSVNIPAGATVPLPRASLTQFRGTLRVALAVCGTRSAVFALLRTGERGFFAGFLIEKSITRDSIVRPPLDNACACSAK